MKRSECRFYEFSCKYFDASYMDKSIRENGVVFAENYIEVMKCLDKEFGINHIYDIHIDDTDATNCFIFSDIAIEDGDLFTLEVTNERQRNSM